MLRASSLAILVSMSFFTFGTANVMAASDESACLDSGGTYTKDGGTATCTYPVGNSDNTKVVKQKGSFASSQDSTLTNPGDNTVPGQTNKDDIPK